MGLSVCAHVNQKDRTFHQEREEHQVRDVVKRPVCELIQNYLHAQAQH